MPEDVLMLTAGLVGRETLTDSCLQRSGKLLVQQHEEMADRLFAM